jgi:hypothetical protein
LNDESKRLIADGKSKTPLDHACGDYSVGDPEFPETAVGLSEALIRQYYDKAGFDVTAIHYGSWCRPDGPFYQDVVLAVRR